LPQHRGIILTEISAIVLLISMISIKINEFSQYHINIYLNVRVQLHWQPVVSERLPVQHLPHRPLALVLLY
jgi:hypothetical protein